MIFDLLLFRLDRAISRARCFPVGQFSINERLSMFTPANHSTTVPAMRGTEPHLAAMTNSSGRPESLCTLDQSGSDAPLRLRLFRGLSSAVRLHIEGISEWCGTDASLPHRKRDTQ